MEYCICSHSVIILFIFIYLFLIHYVRGGNELGQKHYDQGRRLLKWNTFLDYKCCAEYLIQNNFTTPLKLCGSFRSAGGLIGGVMMNQFPHLFAAFIMRY